MFIYKYILKYVYFKLIICDDRVHRRSFEIKSGNMSYVFSKLVCICVSVYLNMHVFYDREMTDRKIL